MRPAATAIRFVYCAAAAFQRCADARFPFVPLAIEVPQSLYSLQKGRDGRLSARHKSRRMIISIRDDIDDIFGADYLRSLMNTGIIIWN